MQLTNRNLVTTLHLHDEPPPRSQHPAKFGDHKSCKSGDINFSNCLVI